MTPEEHDLLVNLAKDVSGLKQDMKKIDNRLTVEIAGLKQDMKKIDNRLTVEIAGLKQDMKKMDNKLTVVTSELERQRKNMAVMEFNLSEKIDALFDEREINAGNFKTNRKKFKSIDTILEQHAYRISTLESKIN